MFVLDRRTDDGSVIRFEPPRSALRRGARLLRRERIDRALSAYPVEAVGGWSNFTDDRSEYGSSVNEQLPRGDLVHMHWIGDFVDVGATLSSIEVPIVWTAHDMNPFTGGCHYDGGCGRYMGTCGCCPVLASSEERDLSHRVWTRKRHAFGRLDQGQLHVVASSQWLAARARESRLLDGVEIVVIPNGIDLTTFAPRDPSVARAAFHLPTDARIVMFVADRADDPRKGFSQLVEAVRQIDGVPGLLLVTVGGGTAHVPAPIQHRALGHIGNERLLALAYSAADVLAVPSLQEAMGATALEALACGIPVVGFETGGIAEIVRNGVNGRLAPVGDVPSLNRAIKSVLEDSADGSMSAAARKVAEDEYDIRTQVTRHAALYERLVDEAAGRSLG